MDEDRPLRLAHPVEPSERRQIVPNGVLGMMVFIITEAMFFAGLVSAFTLAKANALGGLWPPPGQVRLPAEATAINTLALVASGILIFAAGRKFDKSPASAIPMATVSILLGAIFVVLQGAEGVVLVSQGLTMTTSTHGAFFYLIVGSHALHTVVGLGALAWMYRELRGGRLTSSAFWTVRIFWYFVVGLWPILYYKVYLA